MLVLLSAWATLPGSAAAATKPYTLDISPGTVAAGSQATFSAKFTNPVGAQQQLGSADLTPRAGLVLVPGSVVLVPGSASLSAPGTASVSGNKVLLRDLSLQPGNWVTVTVKADVTCSPAVPTGRWTVQAKQANNFRGEPGNDLTLEANSSVTTTISGQCKLQFAPEREPANAIVGEKLTAEPYDPGGLPVAVEVLDGDNVPVASIPPTPVTITASTLAGPATLGGRTSTNTDLGVAVFADLTLGAPNTYNLVASSPGLTSATAAVRIDTVAVACSSGVSCRGTGSTGRTRVDLTAESGAAGFLTLSFNAGLSVRCGGYDAFSADTALVDMTATDRRKQVTLTIDKRDMNAKPNNGASFLELCFGAPKEFITKAGSPSLPDDKTFFDWDFDGTADPVYVGLLPNCGPQDKRPCVNTRKKVGAGDGQLEASIPAGYGDPAMRG